MINSSAQILILDRENLDTAVRAAITATLMHLLIRYGVPPPRAKWSSRLSQHAMHFLFGEGQIKKDAVFDEVFLQHSLAFVGTTSQNKGSNRYFETLKGYIDAPNPPATALSAVKRGIKILLVELWNQGAILLPTIFSPYARFEPIPIKSELYDFTLSCNPDRSQDAVNSIGTKAELCRIFYYMPRILFATSWRRIEDVSLDELAILQRAQWLYLSDRSETQFIVSAVPWTLFATKLLTAFPSKTSYNKVELARYSDWLHRAGGIGDCPFTEFYPTQEKERANAPLKRRKHTFKTKKGAIDRLTNWSQTASHEAALRYFSDYQQWRRNGIEWLNDTPFYPGREHVNLDASTQFWFVAFRAFMHHRKHVKGYESDSDVASALNMLADYLFLYLPWWKELYPQSHVVLPSAPKDFLRYVFVYRNFEEDISELPVTFLDIVKLRRSSPGSQYSACKHVQLFFKFVEAHFSEDESIAGATFRTPIFDEFDMPRIPKRWKTSKVVFPKNAYGFLIYYGYAVEAFGEFLLERCMEQGFSQKQLRQLSTSRLIGTAQFGFVPFVQYRDKLSPLWVVPNVFTWATRAVRSASAEKRLLFIPHLTTLRVLITAVEIGLRLASVCWLDRRTWDKHNSGCLESSAFSFRPSGQYVYGLDVSTDKAKDGPWETAVVFRVRALLLREQQFQSSIDEIGMDEEVPYKGRSDSRFGNIRPLFRSASSAAPISSNNYESRWILYMVGFQSFFSKATGSFVPFIKIQPTSSTVDNPKIVREQHGAQYCPVSILAVSTPHACRASFATNRQGILETSEIAELLGHENPVVTEYYQSPRAEDLYGKLELSDRAIHDASGKFDKDNAAYMRADKDDSALIRNFVRDRQGTLASFGFMPPMSLWSLAESGDMNEKAIDALRNGPMSLIRFRETHICPVGEECPSDIVIAIGGFKRCGLCPLALKCIDHLPAIAAKKHGLLERIKYLSRQKQQLEASGEPDAIEDIWEAMNLETNELLGWQLSEEVLTKLHTERIDKGEADVIYHAEQPDIVRRHLQRVVKQTGPAEFVLHRIAESNAYPSLQSPEIQAVAANIRRRLLAGQDVADLLVEAVGPQDVDVAANLLRTVMQANNFTVEEMSNRLTDRSTALPSLAPLRIGAST